MPFAWSLSATWCPAWRRSSRARACGCSCWTRAACCTCSSCPARGATAWHRSRHPATCTPTTCPRSCQVRAGSRQLHADRRRPPGPSATPRRSSEQPAVSRVQRAGRVTALVACSRHLCVATSQPDALQALSTADLRPPSSGGPPLALHAITEPATMRQRVAGLFGSLPAARVAALARVDLPGASRLAVLYAEGSLSLWHPATRTHLASASIAAPPGTPAAPGSTLASAMCAPRAAQPRVEAPTSRVASPPPHRLTSPRTQVCLRASRRPGGLRGGAGRHADGSEGR